MLDMSLPSALDVFQHWVMSETAMDDDRREAVKAWTAVPIFERGIVEEDSWAPSWWQGDEEAAMSGIAAAAKLDMSRRG